MTQRKDRSETDTAHVSETPTADGLEDLRTLIFGANPGRGAVRKAVEEAGVRRALVQRAIQPSTIEAIREVEEVMRDAPNT